MNDWRPVETVPVDTWVFVWARTEEGRLAEIPAIAYWHDDSGQWVNDADAPTGHEDPWEVGVFPDEWDIAWWMPIEPPEET